MTVLTFPPRPENLRSWHPAELEELLRLFSAHRHEGNASTWGLGATELGDPQFYILGPAPECECILCLSRIGRLYVLEDGSSKILAEDLSLKNLANKGVCVVFGAGKSSLIVRATCLWCAVRHSLEEKIEPMLAEPAEFLVHIAPPLAALV